ncbi:MAG: gluconeogenesis factor YvcK family protein [Acidobacteriota bacterium]
MDMARKGLNVVAIGGGNGLSTLLYGLKDHVAASAPVIADLSAIVTVSDDGGSSGRLREELQMLPPGDIRNCMVALSEDSGLLSKLFRYRFRGDGDLGGHSFGNIFLAALTELTGDFAEAVKLSSEILASKGHIYPATMSDVRLAAELEDGTVVRGESKIGKIGSAIKRIYLEPDDCQPMPDALSAIENADIISVGPGSLFTSLLPPLLVNGVSEAIERSPAVKVFICNLMTQPGETDGFTSRKHLEIIRDHSPPLAFDYIVLNDRPITRKQESIYGSEGAVQIGVDGSISGSTIDGVTIIYDNLLSEGDMVRHDSARLATRLIECAASR